MRLNAKDLSAVLNLVQDLHSHQEFSSLPQVLIRSLRTLIPAEVSAYNEVDHRFQRITIQHDFEPRDVVEKLTPVLTSYAHEHPVNEYQLRTGERRALKISDFLSARQFQRLGIYNEFYRKLDVRHQISVYLPGPPSLQIALTLQRSKRDFSERDRAILDLLSPHLARVHQVALDFHLAHEKAQAFEAFAHESGQLILTIGKGGRIISSSSDPHPFFSRAGLALERNSFIPSALARRIDPASPAGPPFTIVTAEGKLRVTVQRLQGETIRVLLQFKREHNNPSILRGYGLSSREADVLHFIAEGKTNAEIGLILNISERTVHKHVEHIFRKLRLENRWSAIKFVFETRQDLSEAR